ncbi:MAG: NAD(P)-dependent glycerol-3-phosphate dehydrogenase [Phycisphaeraceae bacterium]|nr:NAD(P)-dependent glycerol-3-phosphate dehydrogenase [Phycisphaeraceae bacterium]
MARSNPTHRTAPDAAALRRRIVILGTGQMGLVCAAILAPASTAATGTAARKRAGRADAPAAPHIVMWGHDADEVGELTQTRTSPRLPGFELPDCVRVTGDLRRAVSDGAGASLVVSAVPVQFTRDVWKRLRAPVPADAAVVSVAKGIENNTLLRPTQVIADALGDDPDGPPRPIGTLSGPTIAGELARGLPATMIAASDWPGYAHELQRVFSTQYLRVYTNEDVLGVELAGATKNVIAIAAGILDGLQAGYNAKSALLARGLAEITRLGVAMGASTDTFFGLAGVGDLATTCFSPEGRNRSCGEALGRGVKLDEYLRAQKSVVEGVATTKSVMDLARKYRVEMPITEQVHAVLFENVDPIDAIARLMSRELTSERVG